MSKTFERHMASLIAGEVGPAFIRGVSRAFTAIDRRAQNYSVGSTASGMTQAELTALVDKIMASPPRIEPKQSAKGLGWLRTPKVRRKLDEFQRAVVDDFDHFTLAGFFDIGQHNVAFMVPMYTVHAHKHYLDPKDPRPAKRFTYSVASWQAGGAMDFHN